MGARSEAFEKWIKESCPENEWGDPTNSYEWPRSEAETLDAALTAAGFRVVKLDEHLDPDPEELQRFVMEEL